jgi:probable phosphoglycerate mutase
MATVMPGAETVRAPGPPLQVWFVRHGETAWSLSGQHTGHTDLPLTAHGETMALALQPLLAATPFSLVLTSPRLRARATCGLAGLGAAAQTETDLAEWDYGEYEGLRSIDIRRQLPDWDVWRDGCPGGEMPGDVGLRADRVIARLSGTSGRVILFSHGQFGRVLAARWIGLPVHEGMHFALDPAAICILSSEAGRPERRIISMWNASPAALERHDPGH